MNTRLGHDQGTRSWIEQAYDDTYRGMLCTLEHRRRSDPGFGVDEARSVLHQLYVQDGNDWIGRGELGDVVMRATIDAYEGFVSEWENAPGFVGERPEERT